LIEQLQIIKNDGVTPNFILVGADRTDELSGPIKEIFPNIFIN
jgi:hypothetical protein